VPVKVVVDTNIWISALVAPTKTTAAFVEEWRKDKFCIIASEQQLLEIYEVLIRPKFLSKYLIHEDEIINLVISLMERANCIPLKGDIELCRDPDDNMIIETAIRGKAKYLITGDKDIKDDKHILKLLSQYGISVISISKFLDVINKT